MRGSWSDLIDSSLRGIHIVKWKINYYYFLSPGGEDEVPFCRTATSRHSDFLYKAEWDAMRKSEKSGCRSRSSI
jgi:hypothetical protein